MNSSHRSSFVRLALLAAVAAVPFAGIARAADDAQPSAAQLQDQIRQLQQKVDQLQSQQEQNSQVNRQVVDETIAKVLADSEKRSKLLQLDAGMTAGFENDRFFIKSTDGNWSFMPGFVFQFRNITNYNTEGDESLQNGFEVRRAKIIFDGTLGTKDLFYHFQWNTSNSTGAVSLEDALVRYDFGNGFLVRAGQYKDPWTREENISDQKQLAVERSLVNALIGGAQTGRVQGASVMYETGQTHSELMLHDGANSINTAYNDELGGINYIGGTVNDNFGVSGRFDYYFTKKTKEIDDFTALNNKEDLLVLGGGFDYTQGGDNTAIFHTVDLQWENTEGFNAFAAYYGTYRDVGTATATAAPPAGNFYDWGFLVQGGYLINPKLEVFARYDYTKFDDDSLPAGVSDDAHEITIGANYYLYKHNVKFTVDGSWLPNGSPSDASGLGVTASGENEFLVRAQVQLYL